MIRRTSRRLFLLARLVILVLWRALRDVRHVWVTYAVPWLLSPLGYLRTGHQIVLAEPDARPILGPRVALLCHFDRAGRVRPDLLDHIRELHAAGFSVVLISNSGQLLPEARDSLRPSCAAVLVRRNIGYDFCAWRDALTHLGLPRADTQRILLVNDSVYGPVAPLAPVLRRIEKTDAEIVALTDSQQRGWHLQSYFVCFGPAAFRSSAWTRFWSGVRPVPSKQWVINRCEVGLTRTFRDAGMRCVALWPVAALLSDVGNGALSGHSLAQARRVLEATRRNQAVNPTHDLWRVLLESGFPFIKRELLRDNPSRVMDIADWREIARGGGATGLNRIEHDLRTA